MIIDKSEKLDELFKALANVQGQVNQPLKDQSGYLGRYKYADLSQYIDLSKDLLESNGLSVTQLPGSIKVISVTREETKDKPQADILVPVQEVYVLIGHDSGQFIGGTMDIIIEKMAGNSWGQCAGSAISYGRRYSRGGALGMNAEDDDNQLKNKKEEPRQSTQKPLPEKQHLVNEAQVRDLRTIINQDAPTIAYIKRKYKIEKLEELPESQYIEVRDLIRSFDSGIIKTESPISKVA